MKKKIFLMLLVIVAVLTISVVAITASADSTFPPDNTELLYTDALLDFDMNLIAQVGHQDFNGAACSCFALAYARTITDGYIHRFYEYNTYGNTQEKDSVICAWEWGKYSGAGYKEERLIYFYLYKDIQNGKPSIVKVSKIDKSTEHFVTVVGFKNVTSFEELGPDNFIVIDPGTSSFTTLKTITQSGYKLYKSTKKDNPNPYFIVRPNSTVPSVGFASYTENNSYLKEHCTFTPSNAIIKLKQDYTPRSLPCNNNTATALGFESVALTDKALKKDDEITVAGIYYNSENNYWYKVVFSDKTVGYIYSERTLKKESVNPYIQNGSFPSNISGATNLQGTVNNNNVPIDSITAKVYKGNTLSGTPVISYTDNSVNSKTYPLKNSDLDIGLPFQNLANYGSGTYTLAYYLEWTDYFATGSELITLPRSLCIGSYVFTFSTSSPECSHTYDSGVISLEPTCSNYGIKTYKCTKCNTVRTETIPATGNHIYDSGVISLEPTCSNYGVIDYTCIYCSESYSQTIPMKEHIGSITTTNDSTYPFELSGNVYASTNKTDNSSSVFTINAVRSGVLSIAYSISSEANYDKLIIEKNGTILAEASGELDWNNFTIDIAAGDVITITYIKDVSSSHGSDTCWFSVIERFDKIDCTEEVLCFVCQTVIREATAHSYVDGVCKNCGMSDPDTPIIIRPFNNGWENWSGQTQLLIVAPFDSKYGAAEYEWELTIGNKTIRLIPSSFYDFGDGTTIWRFEPCLGLGENKFIPESGVSYTISANVYNNGILVYRAISKAGVTWNVPADLVPIVPQPCSNGHSYVNGVCENCGYSQCINHIESDYSIVDYPASIGQPGQVHYECTICKEVLRTEATTIVESGTYENLTWVYTCDGTLTISGSGIIPGHNFYYDSSDAPWDRYCEEIVNVIINDGIDGLGEGAFYNFVSLENIVIPESVTTLGYGVFMSCRSLKTITLPQNITSIPYAAFSSCTSLTSVTIPEGVTIIDGEAFYYCTSLTNIIIPEGVTSIRWGTFYYCESLTSITIPGSVTIIAEAAFGLCTALENVYYSGTIQNWNGILIASVNDYLINATIHYASGCSHSYVGTVTREATCYNYGVIDYTCIYCSESYSQTIPMKEHIGSITTTNDSTYPFELSGNVYASTNKTDNSSSVFTINAVRSGVLSIAYSISSEANYDELVIVKNGMVIATASGELDWNTLTIDIAAGDVITLTYRKDGSVAGGSDTCWFSVIERFEKLDCTEEVVCCVCQTVIREAAAHSYVNGTCENCGYSNGSVNTVINKFSDWEYIVYENVNTSAPSGWTTGNDSAYWTTAQAPFSGSFFPSASSNTLFEYAYFRCYMRQTFTLDSANVRTVTMFIKYDEEPIIYINGIKVWDWTENTDTNNNYVDTMYVEVDLSAYAYAFKQGENIIAVDWNNEYGGSVMDLQLDITTGFVAEADGTRYYYADGSFAKGFVTIEGKTYRFDPETGILYTEPVLYGANTYYFNADHSTVEGIVYEDGGMRFYKKGVRQYGWVDMNGDGKNDTYFFVSSQLRCEEDRVLFDGVDARRFFRYNTATGHMEVVNGFYTNENGTQFFKNGIGQYGWITADGVSITDRPGITLSDVHYFAYGDGLNFYMIESATKTIGGVVREFDENHLVKSYTGWATNKKTGNANYYINGVMQQGWCETPDGWVYLSRSENLANNITYGDVFYGWRKIGGKTYYFRASTSNPAYVIISDPIRQLTYNGVRGTYYINQTVVTGTGADYYITNPPGSTPTVCAHEYKITFVKDATCTAKGCKTYTCSKCNNSYNEEINVIAHNYAEATCTAPKTCKSCGATVGSTKSHNYVNDVCTGCNKLRPLYRGLTFMNYCFPDKFCTPNPDGSVNYDLIVEEARQMDFPESTYFVDEETGHAYEVVPEDVFMEELLSKFALSDSQIQDFINASPYEIPYYWDEDYCSYYKDGYFYLIENLGGGGYDLTYSYAIVGHTVRQGELITYVECSSIIYEYHPANLEFGFVVGYEHEFYYVVTYECAENAEWVVYGGDHNTESIIASYDKSAAESLRVKSVQYIDSLPADIIPAIKATKTETHYEYVLLEDGEYEYYWWDEPYMGLSVTIYEDDTYSIVIRGYGIYCCNNFHKEGESFVCDCGNIVFTSEDLCYSYSEYTFNREFEYL